MRNWVRLPLLILVAALLVPTTGAQAAIFVRATVTPLGGSFRYVFEVENTGPDDFVIVSIVDAPVADPLIDPTLTTPAGFLGSYDGGLGIVDFIEDADLFATGTTHGGFRFDSLAGPSGAFGSFEALTTSGALVSGSVQLTVVNPPGTPMITEGATGGSSVVGGKSTPCDPQGNSQVVVYDCGTSLADCAGCAPGFPPMPCPNPVIGMGSKDANGHFLIPVGALIQGHYIYASDGCTDPPFNVGAPQQVGAPAVRPAIAPLLSVRMVLLLLAVLGLVGWFGITRSQAVR